MPLFTQRFLDEIRTRVSIVDVVSPYTQLRKMGREWRGLSPFNAEKTPSFFVNPEKNVFKCYSSGYGGDTIRFVQLKENLNFQEAVETLAHRFGISPEYEHGTPQEARKMSLSREIYAINALAVDYYHAAFLAQTPDGVKIRAFWTQTRKFPLDLAKEFLVGYAPTDAAGLIALLREKKHSPEALRECGLFFANGMHPRFRGRLMIPIRDVQKRVVGFAARQTPMTPTDIEYEKGKYVNSPETPVFKKGALLFNLDRAKEHVEEDGSFLLVEGQLDALRCWQCGLKSVVAPQGTAVTEAQIAALRNYRAGKLECLLDGDGAGQKATLEKLLPYALKAGMELSVLPLPEGADPDELLRDGGAAAFDSVRKNALSPMEFAARASLPHGRAPSPRERADAFANLAKLILLCDSEIAAQGYLRDAARFLGIDSTDAAHDFSALRRAHLRREARPILPEDATQEPEPEAPENEGSRQLTPADDELLLLVLNHDALAKAISESMRPDWVNTSALSGRLLDRILGALREGAIERVDQFDSLVETEEERAFLIDRYALPERFDDPNRAAQLAFASVQRAYYRSRRALLENQLANTRDAAEQQRLFNALFEIRKLIQNPEPLSV